MSCDLAGKMGLVTGAASGIGAATARAMAAAGAAQLLLVDLDEAGLSALDLPCETRIFAGDVAEEGLWAQVEASGVTLDFAFLNAGIADSGMIRQLAFEDWRRVVSVNLDGMFLSLRTALRLAGEGASVVLTASVAGVKAEPGTAAYAASKAGVLQLARVAAKEGFARRIRVNALAPGGVDTPIWDGLAFVQDLVAKQGGNRAAAMADMAASSTPLGRFASAEEVAGQVLFLLSDAAANITGSVLVADGGYSL